MRQYPDDIGDQFCAPTVILVVGPVFDHPDVTRSNRDIILFISQFKAVIIPASTPACSRALASDRARCPARGWSEWASLLESGRLREINLPGGPA